VAIWFSNRGLLAIGFLALQGSYRQVLKMIFLITSQEIGGSMSLTASMTSAIQELVKSDFLSVIGALSFLTEVPVEPNPWRGGMNYERL
jgi:hypothetical protein